MSERARKSSKSKSKSKPTAFSAQGGSLSRHDHAPEAPSADYAASFDPAALTPNNILRLQRTIGNQAVQRYLGESPTPKRTEFNSSLINRQPQTIAGSRAAASPAVPGVQREEEDGNPFPVGNVYEKKVEYKGDRWSFSLAFNFSKADTSPIKGKDGALSGQVGESKFSSTKSYSKGATKSANSISLALAKSSLEFGELLPGLFFKADVKALEAKLENGEVDVDILKLAFAVDGVLSKAIEGTELGNEILATELGELILNGTAIKLTGKIEIKVDPSDAARLVRMAKLNKEMIKNAEAAAKALKNEKALELDNKRLRDKISKRKNVNPHQRAAWKKRLAANNEKLTKLRKIIDGNKTATKVLKESFDEAAKGLKSKAGRVVGAIVKKVGGKLLLKAIPVIGWLLTAVDVITVLHGLFSGSLEFGLGGGGDGGEGGGEGADGGTEIGVSGGVPDSTSGTGGADGGVPDGGDGGDTGDLGPEIDISEDEAYTPSTGLSSEQGEGGADASQPEMHPAASAVFEAMKSDTGVKLSADDMAQLNSIVPEDLSGDHLAKLLEWLKNNQGKQATDIFEVLGALQDKITQLKEPPQNVIVSDKDGAVEELTITGEAPKKAPEDKPSVEAEQIIAAIKSAKGLMQSKNLSAYVPVPDNIKPDDIKKNTTIQTWVFINENSKYLGGSTMIIVLDRKPGSEQVKIQIQPTTLYQEDGTPVGQWSGTTADLNVL